MDDRIMNAVMPWLMSWVINAGPDLVAKLQGQLLRGLPLGALLDWRKAAPDCYHGGRSFACSTARY